MSKKENKKDNKSPKGVGAEVIKEVPAKRLKAAWKKETQGRVSLKVWAKQVAESGEPKYAADYALKWFENKPLSRLTSKKFQELK